ncbi:ATP-binding protein [Thalassospira sp.]|uniref:ATP-binding protein n=1 Tax=Thalassospira sp. TaxID=1912094 RepID=UPI002735AA8A|nr:ATP-binding protein [Thalassospira sp.]MDP2696891.1 ATP-binding protein [Thalassospira sp.]
MKRFFARLYPRSLTAQLVCLLLGAVILTHVVLAVLLAEERHDAVLSERRGGALARVAAISRILSTTAPENWRDVLRVAESPMNRFRLIEAPDLPPDDDSEVTRLLSTRLNEALDNPKMAARVVLLSESDCRKERDDDDDDDDDKGKRKDKDRRLEQDRDKRSYHGRGGKRFFGDIKCDGPAVMAVSVPIFDNRAGIAPDGDGAMPVVWLDARINGFTPPPWLAMQSLARVVLSALLIGIIAFFVARRVTRPWKVLAAAADRIGRGDFPEPVPEKGPLEIARAARAFNRMSARLKRFVSDRTRMLAAISHDLRTPITSLRLRAEFVDDEENRRKIIETLNEMEQMVEAAMTFAREETANEETRRIDIVALVEATCADLEETGHPVTFVSAIDHLTYACRPLSIKRALGNLLGNGLAYGEHVTVSVKRADDGGLWIDVCDDGPGIPVESRDKVFEPFFRLEESRNQGTGGIGLGLSIARTAIRGHGGEIYLDDAPQGGLAARIYLPAPVGV